MIIVPVRGINHCGVRVVSVSVINHVYLIYPGRFQLDSETPQNTLSYELVLPQLFQVRL